MAIQNILPDLTHIARTTYQWEHTADKYEIIPNGVLCIEFVKVDQTLIKIGDGHHIYKQLPYVSSIDLKNYYTKEETDNRIIEIFNELKSIRIKGEVSDLSNLPTDNNTEGDLWFVRRTSPTGHSRYDEYVWYKNNWESIGLSESDIDLSEYAKKEYVDEKIEEVDEKIDRYMHTHSNKEILDQITAPFTTEKDEKLESLHNYDDTEIRRIIDERTHTHSNKSILDQTSAAYTTDKDNKLESLHNYDDTEVQDRLEILEQIAHFHENKEILDRTTAAFTREQAITLLDCKDFEGTDGTNDGYHGFVPAPTASDAGKVLGANGQWVPMSGGGGGDTVAEGGGISITTDAQTGNKVIAVNAGTGLSIDPVTGELNVTGGGGGGDTVTEGGGISITTDPQTGDKVISVDVGDNLEIDPQTGELNVTGVDYTAGKGIFIGNEYQNVEYIKNSGNYDQIILTDIVPNFSDKLEMDIKFGAATGNTTNDGFIGCTGAVDNNIFHYGVWCYCTNSDSNIGFYNHFVWTQQNTGRNFITRPAGISYDGSDTQRLILTMQGTTASWGNTSINFSNEYMTEYNSKTFVDPQIGISIFGYVGITSKNYFDCQNLTVYGVKLYDSNNTLLHNLVPVKKLSNNEGGLYDTITNKFYGNSGNGSFVTGPAVETYERIINAKIGDGLQFDSNNAIEVNTGDGLSVNQDNELEVNLGSGLQFDSNGAIEVTETGIDFEAGNGLEMVQEGYYDQLPLETYSHCDYVENTNDAHFQLDYLPPQNVRVTGKFSPVLALTDAPVFGSRTNSNANGHQFVLWCSAQSTNVTPYKMGFVSPGNQWGTASEANGGTITSFVQNDIINFDIDFPNAQVLINDEYFQAINVSSSASATVKVGIFSCAKGDTPTWEYKFCGKIYGMKFYVGNAMVVNLVPAVRDSDSVVGFYDNVNDVFYTSITSTAFSTDTSSITKDEPSTQTVNVLNVIPATSGNIGGVIPRRALTVDLKGRLDVDLATSTTPGIVTPKEGLNVDASGELSVAKATSSTMGGVKIGSGIIQAPDGTVNVSAMEPFDIGDGLELEYDSEDALPSGYAYVDYISSNPSTATAASAQARTVIDYVPNANTRYKVRGSRDNANNSTSRNYFCGARQSSSDYQSALLFIGNGTNKSDVGFLYGSAQWANVKYNMDYIPGDIVVIEADANSLKVDGTTVATYTPAGNIPSFKIGVFGATANGNTTPNWTDGYPMNGKIYYLKIYEGNTLVVNLIPAYRYADDTVGFYDNVNDKFYTSITSYPFTTDMTTLNPDPANRKLNVVPATENTIGGIKVGDGLSITADGTLSATGGGSGGGNYSAGEAIEIDTSLFNVDAIRWDISDIKDPIQSFSPNGPWAQVRYIQFRDNSNNVILIDSGSGVWSDDTAVSYYQDLTLANMIANTQKMCASWRSPDLTMKLTFLLDSPVNVSSVAKFRILLGDDEPHRDPKAWSIYVRNATTQEWHLVHTTADAQLPATRNVWTDDFLLENPNRSIINVKYGNGLTVNASNELEVDLPVASDSTLGGVIVGDGLSIDENGVLSATTYLAGDGIGINPYGGLLVENTEYYFDTPVSCEIRGSFNRTFQKTTADPALGVIWKCYDNGNLWGGPLFVGLTADAVKYTTEGTTYNAKGTFTYLGRTWYYSDTSYYVQNPQDHDYLGNLQVFTDAYDYVTDVVDAAKRLIDTAHVYTNNQEEISVKIGQRLKIESDGSVNAKGYLEGEGISIDTTDYLLPTGYTRIKALSSTLNGNQYINTGYKLNPNTIIDMKCTLYKRGTSVWAIPLGARVYNSYAVGGMLFVTTNSDSLVPSTGVDTPSLWIESSLNYPPSGQINCWYNDIIDLHFDNQSVTCENQRTHEQSVITSQTAISATSNYDLYVFATNNGNNAAFFGVMDLYELTISENNVIIHRYIPCKRDSDDKYGLYDIIDNEFKLSPNNNLFSYVPGLPIDDINETISLLPATTTTLGGVKIGEGLYVDSEGYISSKLYEAGQGITFDEAAPEGQFKVRNLEYYFDTQVSWQINGDYGPRTFTRVAGSEQCLIAIVQTTAGGRIWTTPACIGLTETSCKYSNSYDSYIIGPDTSFDYKGYTWYIGMNYGLLNSTGVDLLGNVQGPINLTSIDTGNNQNLDLVGKAIIDLAGLVVYEESIDVWNSGTGWLNGAYNDSQSDQFWTNWYYTYHSKQNEYFEVPAGAIKMRLIGISNENDSRLQGGGVDCFNSSHHHFTSVGCMTDEWADIPDDTVYLQFGVKWNELNDRTISSSDIKSVNIEFYYDTPRNDAINAKLGNGLEFDSNDAIQVKLGDGLGFDANGALEVTGGGGGGDSIDEGAGIEITTDPLTDVKTISINYGTGLTVDPITNELMVNGQLPEGTIIKKMTFVGNGSTSSNTIQFEKKPLAILNIYGLSGTNYISSIGAPIDAPYLQGNYGGVSTNGNSCSCRMAYNDATNELTFTPSAGGGSDAGLLYNVNGVTYTMFYLIKGHTGSGTSVNNEVSVIKSFSYTGTGTTINNIQFPETPDMILDIHGPLGVNGDITTSPIDIKHPSPASQYTLLYSYQGGGHAHMGSYSFNDTTNVLTLTGNDYGACMNYDGYTYYVDYIVNEVIASSNYVEGDGIEIDPVTGEISVNIGTGLAFDPQTGAINVTGGGGGSGDTVAEGNGISITTDQQTGNKVIAVNAGSGLQINQSTHELEATGVSSISATPNTPGSITITNGSTSTPLSVISQMGGASSSTAGSAGYVPAPASGDDDAYLRGDGVWDDDVLTENDNFTITFVPDDYQPT